MNWNIWMRYLSFWLFIEEKTVWIYRLDEGQTVLLASTKRKNRRQQHLTDRQPSLLLPHHRPNEWKSKFIERRWFFCFNDAIIPIYILYLWCSSFLKITFKGRQLFWTFFYFRYDVSFRVYIIGYAPAHFMLFFLWTGRKCCEMLKVLNTVFSQKNKSRLFYLLNLLFLYFFF